MNDNLTLTEQLQASLQVVPPNPTASELRREIGLRYDGEIPAEALAAIAAAEQEEREHRLTAHLSDAGRLRFQAAKTFRLAKGEFRTFCRMLHRGSFNRADECFHQLRKSARSRAYPHVEAWAALRHQERRASERLAAE